LKKSAGRNQLQSNKIKGAELLTQGFAPSNFLSKKLITKGGFYEKTFSNRSSTFSHGISA
jgi:hypothetical protein